MFIKSLLFVIIAFVYADDPQDTLHFRYGLLLNPIANKDTLYAIEDSSIIYTKDSVRLNVAYLPKTYFYVYFLGTDNIFIELYTGYENNGDTLYYDTAMHWQKFKDPQGLEQFYLINSINKLTELENAYTRYNNAKGRMKDKLGISLQALIDNLDPEFDDMAIFNSELDNPISGGVTFRGDDDDKLRESDVTHISRSSNDVLVTKISIHHK